MTGAMHQLAHQVVRDLDELIRTGQAVPVKENLQRTVYRVHLHGEQVHVKRCRVNSWRAWFRERLRPPKAILEFDKLMRALERQVPTLTPLAHAVTADGTSILVTRTIDNAVSLDRWLESLGPVQARARFAVAEALGRLLAHLHHAGVLHPDLHPGNLLIRWRESRPELFLLDLHNAHLGRPVSVKQSLANLVLVNRWFILRGYRTDRLRCWRAYIAERFRLGAIPIDYFAARRIERETWQSNQRLWRSHRRRCWGTNRRFWRLPEGHAVRDVRPAEWLALQSLLASSSTGIELKRSPSSRVTLHESVIGGIARSIICKQVRTSAARKSWANGHALLDTLLPTPRPLALIEQGRVAVLMTDYIPDAIDLRQAAMEPSRRRERIDRVARLVRELHQRGWSHRDLKAANILLAHAGESERAWLIDLVGASQPWFLTRRRREKDLARLNASFHELPQVSRTDRLRFLRHYLNWNLHGRGDWKRWWWNIARRTLDKVAKNQRRGRPLA